MATNATIAADARRTDRRQAERRDDEAPFAGEEQRTEQRRSGSDRRNAPRVRVHP